MRKKRQTIDELAEEKLPKSINKAINGVELKIDTQNNCFHVVANRKKFEMKVILNWGKVAALVLGLIKIGKYWKSWS